MLINEGIRNSSIPYNLTIYKGMKSYRLPRSFVEFLLYHPVSAQFLQWSKATAIPDEMVVPTLARISHTAKDDNGWVVHQAYVPKPRYHLQNRNGWLPCYGSVRNQVCIFSLKDLSIIIESGAHIINKFRSDMHPYVGQCIKEMVDSRAIKGG